MTIKELKRLCELRNCIITEAIRIERKIGFMDENYRRLSEYCYQITSLFPDSTFLSIEAKMWLLDFVANELFVMNNYTEACKGSSTENVSHHVAQCLGEIMDGIGTEYKENRLDFE